MASKTGELLGEGGWRVMTNYLDEEYANVETLNNDGLPTYSWWAMDFPRKLLNMQLVG